MSETELELDPTYVDNDPYVPPTEAELEMYRKQAKEDIKQKVISDISSMNLDNPIKKVMLMFNDMGADISDVIKVENGFVTIGKKLKLDTLADAMAEMILESRRQ